MRIGEMNVQYPDLISLDDLLKKGLKNNINSFRSKKTQTGENYSDFHLYL